MRRDLRFCSRRRDIGVKLRAVRRADPTPSAIGAQPQRPIRASGLKPGLRDAGEAARGHGADREPVRSPRASSIRRRRPARPTPPERDPNRRRSRIPTRRPIRAFANMLAFANSDLAFSGNHAVRRQLPRLQHLRHRAPGQAEAAARRSSAPAARATCRCTATCCSCRSSRRAAASIAAPQGVQGNGQHRALPRRPHLRHHRSEEAEAGGGGADVPRLAHAHAGDRSEGQGQPLRLRLGHRRRCARPRSWPAARG